MYLASHVFTSRRDTPREKTEREQAAEYRKDPNLHEVVANVEMELEDGAEHIIHRNTQWNIERVFEICHILNLRTFTDLTHLDERITNAPPNKLQDREKKMLCALAKVCRSEDAYFNFCVRAHMKKLGDKHIT